LLILADSRIPQPAFASLQDFGTIIPILSSGITYPAISGHPDIFFCRVEKKLIVAPNLPLSIKQKLSESTIAFREGEKPVGPNYPHTAQFNAVVTDKFLIHNTIFTDPVILRETSHLEKINVKQGYTRCNLLALKNNRFITSDKGIETELIKRGFEVLLVSPEGILLPGFDHGFFGGCCGVSGDKVFFTGSLNRFPEGEKVKNFLHDYEIIELYDGPLFDGGWLIFLQNSFKPKVYNHT